jgi:hypothetical protein
MTEGPTYGSPPILRLIRAQQRVMAINEYLAGLPHPEEEDGIRLALGLPARDPAIGSMALCEIQDALLGIEGVGPTP